MAKKKTTTKKKKTKKQIATLTHDEAKRPNIPTAEFQSVMAKDVQKPIPVLYERGVSGLEHEKETRNHDLDPQLVWRGKDEKDWSDLVVQAPPLFIQEKVHPKVLVDDLRRRSEAAEIAKKLASAQPGDIGQQFDLFADFNGLPDDLNARTEFYQHDANWSNRMILGDSLQVMASLAEREGLRGKVQCIYIDPPYGIKFNSNFQWSTTSRDVRDGKSEHITREPEQVKAFRDTWRDGIHSYLTYLRDRLSVARELLNESGSVFVQIGDENVHRVRALMDEVFGEQNSICTISFQTSGGKYSLTLPTTVDYLLWYGRNAKSVKYRQLFHARTRGTASLDRYDMVEAPSGETRRLSKTEVNDGVPDEAGVRIKLDVIYSDGDSGKDSTFYFEGRKYECRRGTHWKTSIPRMYRLAKANRVAQLGRIVMYRRREDDFPVTPIHDRWDNTKAGTGKTYVVQTASSVIERCVLMTTDPGDLVLDPTCGSGTTAYVSEHWGRRWITIDTSRVALALARARIMGARYPYYLLADSRDGKLKEAAVTRSQPQETETRGDIRQGFVYERVPHIMLSSIAHNTEIDVIWEQSQIKLEPLREKLNVAIGKDWEEWKIPHDTDEKWSAEAKKLHADWWEQRIARQKEIDASIAAKADTEYLYDKPYVDNKKVRVAGPFTVESLSPHRVLAVDADDELIDPARAPGRTDDEADFAQMIMENLKTAGVQQAHKEDKITFSSIAPWPGHYICAVGLYVESETDGKEKRAGIFIGPEFGTVARPDLVAAAREAGDGDFDVLIACAFNYEAHATEFTKLGRIPVLKARMNADLHMADDLKNTGKGNLFVIFGEPDIDILPPEDAPQGADTKDYAQVRVKINGVDVFHPQTGEIRSDGAEGIACWFIDTDYNEESFFVRHAYFLGANDPYKSLKTTLKAEINEEAWATLHSDTSRPFNKPEGGRIAVKVINHLGDEVMKVFRVE